MEEELRVVEWSDSNAVYSASSPSIWLTLSSRMSEGWCWNWKPERLLVWCPRTLEYEVPPTEVPMEVPMEVLLLLLARALCRPMGELALEWLWLVSVLVSMEVLIKVLALAPTWLLSDVMPVDVMPIDSLALALELAFCSLADAVPTSVLAFTAAFLSAPIDCVHLVWANKIIKKMKTNFVSGH
jgi:hypothetical protein